LKGKELPLVNRLLRGGLDDFDNFTTKTAESFLKGIVEAADVNNALYALDPVTQERKDKIAAVLKAALSEDDSFQFIDRSIVPWLKWLGLDELNRGTRRRIRNKLIEITGTSPGFIEGLFTALESGYLANEDRLLTVIWFLEAFMLQTERVEDSTCNGSVLKFARLVASQLPPKRIGIIADRLIALLAPESLRSPKPNHEADLSLNDLVATSPGGRHNNDRDDFRLIQIVPTVQELLSTEIPFLPTARDRWPMLDREFRLLRHDLVASFKEVIDQLPETLGAPKKGTRVPLILEKVELKGFDFHGRGNDEPSFRIGFNFPPTFPTVSMKHGARVTWWKSGPGLKRLSRGTMVFIATAESLHVPLLLATIEWRDDIALSNDQPQLGLRFTDRASLEKALLFFMSPPSVELVCVVVRVALFAYEPVLVRMQKLGLVPFPEDLDDQRDKAYQPADFAADYASIARQYCPSLTSPSPSSLLLSKRTLSFLILIYVPLGMTILLLPRLRVVLT